MSDPTWPPSLKEWVGKCLGQMTDSNRSEAQAEMKKVINQAFLASSLWTTDWASIKLDALEPKVTSFSLKRKPEMPPAHINALSPKKSKNSHDSYTPQAAGKTKVLLSSNVLEAAWDPHAAAKAKRLERFSREHDIERQRSGGGYGAGGGNLYATGAALGFVPAKVAQGGKWKGKTASKRSMYSQFQSDENDTGETAATMNWDAFKIVGRSQELFKNYLRLTSEPDPATIRPKPILEKTLLALKSRWRDDQNYPWVRDQFKSLRQDLTVQRIKDEFTVSVYEIHARMALESNDFVEFNACIATLAQLYETGINGKNDEFLAYRILYLVHARNRSEINRLVGQLTQIQKDAACVAHALQVQRAVASNNYHALFTLYNTAPNMGGYIMDAFVARERTSALMCMTKSYKPGVPLTVITSELAFDSLEEADKFLVEHDARVYTDQHVRMPLAQRVLDCKTASPALTAAFEKKYRKVLIRGVV